MEKLHTKVQEMTKPPQFATTLLFNVSHRQSHELNMGMEASSSKDLVYTWSMVPFYLEPILLELKGGRYLGPIFMDALVEMLSGPC